jgi:CheY-like chemotaxis protein
MEPIAKLLSSIATIAWPVIVAVLLFKLFAPIRTLIESARQRKFSIKVAGNELTMEEASEQQRQIISDIQTKLAELEKRLTITNAVAPIREFASAPTSKRILWVDDQPRNNSYLVATLEERGFTVDIALSTKQGLENFTSTKYDIVISDMARPEGRKAGIDLARRILSLSPNVPFFIFCGSWAARNLRDESLQAGVTEITSSGTTLLALLPMTDQADQ